MTELNEGIRISRRANQENSSQLSSNDSNNSDNA
jgi:hypothetical protein